MQKRTLKVALLAVLSVILVLGLSSVALGAQSWPDLPSSVTAKYDITEAQVAEISDGYKDGLWRPYRTISRAEFTKLAVNAFDIRLVDPATPSFTDVAKGSTFYTYIEAAKAAGIVNGTTETTFSPNADITRQQALAIIARYVADVNGYDLATMYTAEEVDMLLAHFGDAADISEVFKNEMAFAFDFGITKGNSYGNLDPVANLTRIQGAAMLIRAQALVPPENWTAANIELVSADKSENLIGKTRQVTFEVTTADGHPAKGVLVDVDVLGAGDFYVGNISPQAAVTNNYGQVTVSLLSTEPGTQRVAATVAGVGTIYTTAYWVALDEVYITDSAREYENNAGESQTVEARAVVFGPGPLSTSAQDWYNAYKPNETGALAAVDWPIGWAVSELIEAYGTLLPVPGDLASWPTDDQVAWFDNWLADHEDSLDEFPGGLLELVNLILSTDRWSYDVEVLGGVHGYLPRGMADVTMNWEIVNVVDDNPRTVSVDETVPSVGDIVEVDGVAISAAKEADGKTDAAGLSSVAIKSEATGQTKVQVVADYAGNPYPGQLFNHLTSQIGLHFLDWNDQPLAQATALLTWIPAPFSGDSDAPITPAYAVNNTGEVETYTLTLKDIYDNPIQGYTVLWWLQGVGEFKTTGASWSGVGEQNKQWDTTDASGQAKVQVKSLTPGQTIIHCKVMDKYGLPYKEWNVVKQWYSIDEVNFTDKLVWVDKNDNGKVDDEEMVIPANPVNSGHTFNVQVSGAKYVHVLYDVNGNGLMDDQALLGDRADLKAAEGYVAKMQGNQLTWVPKDEGVDVAPGEVFRLTEGGELYTRYAKVTLDGAEYWADKLGDDGIKEVWSGLEGKTVYFFTNVETEGGEPIYNMTSATAVSEVAPLYVGTITSATEVVTDANGEASVTINSTNKGTQYVYAVADYEDNPQDGNPLKPQQWKELRYDVATKVWLAAAPATVKIFEAGDPNVEGMRWVNPVLGYEAGEDNPNRSTIAVQVFDEYGNALEGYKVTWEIIGQGTTTSGTQPTYHPYAHFEDPEHDLLGTGTADVGDRNPHVDANPLWPAPDGSGAGDDDWAWGYTLDHQINFTLDTNSAAYVDLVLDETREGLSAKDTNHFTNIVNIKVYSPTGALYQQFEVTKVWSLEPGQTATAVLEQREAEGSGYTTGPVTLAAGEEETCEQTYQVTVLDEYGNPVVTLPGGSKLYFDSDVPGQDFVQLATTLTATLQPGVWTVTFWIDDNNNNIIDANEIKSNDLVTTVLAAAPTTTTTTGEPE